MLRNLRRAFTTAHATSISCTSASKLAKPPCRRQLNGKRNNGIGKYGPVFEPLEPRMLLDGNSLLITEFMAINDSVLRDGDAEFKDWVEIHNPSGDPVDMQGWYLTDDANDLTQWQFPATTLAPGEFRIVFASGKHPNGPPALPGETAELHTNFKLKGDGEYLGLVWPDGTTVQSDFGTIYPQQYSDVSYGRSSDFSTLGYFPESTPRAPNAGQPVDDPTQLVVINEIMYHPFRVAPWAEEPGTPLVDPPNQNDREDYIELLNQGVEPVDLTGWYFSDGVDFTFPAFTLAAGEYLVVAADLAAFQAKYPAVANVIGGWEGQLSNRGEDIELADSTGKRVDRVRYADEGDWAVREQRPADQWGHEGWIWTAEHDGGGKSLELINSHLSNNQGPNWAASEPDGGTPGVANSVVSTDIAPMILDVIHTPAIPRAADPVTVTAELRDEVGAGVVATVHYRIDGDPDFTPVAMADDGQSGDGQPNDGVYGAVIPAAVDLRPETPDGTIVEFYVHAVDAAANERTYPAATQPSGEQLTNLLYQVDDSFDPNAAWKAGSQPVYYLIMTEAERAELADIGDGGGGGEQNSDAQMNGTFIGITGTDTEVRYNVGVRNRGAGTRNNPPNNHRVNFPHDRPYKDVTAININSKYTQLQFVGSAIVRMAGLPAEDAVAIQVRVNGENLAETGNRMYGSYVQMQVPDSDFADKQFADDGNGNVYRASRYPWTADLAYLGTDPQDYISAGYSKATNSGENDWTDLINLTYWLNEGPDATYVEDVSQVINVDQWLRWFALQTLIGNNETNLGNGRGDDYGMYRGVEDPRFVLLTHDLDTILGLGDNPSSVTDSIFRADRVAAIGRFLRHPEFVGRYFAQLEDLIATTFSPEQIDPLLDHTLGGYVPAQTITQMKQFVVARNAFVLSVIPDALSIASTLPVVGGYYQTNVDLEGLTGTAPAAETRSVLVDGQVADWSPVDGTWSIVGQPGTTVSDTLVAADAAVAYHVPTEGEDLAAWTAADFIDDDWNDTTRVGGAGVLITEIATGPTRLVEIENVADSDVDVTGWQVLLNDATSGNINSVGGTAWSLSGSMASGEVLYRTDDAGENYFGSEIFWDAEGPGWVMIVDGSGQVMDFLAWGYSPAEIAAASIDFGALTNITVGNQWSGPAAEVGTADFGDPATSFVAYNDHIAGPVTHPNATSYAANPGGISSGLLRDVATGDYLGARLTTSEVDVLFDISSAPPAPGTDAFAIFNGFIDFSGGAGSGASIEIEPGDRYEHAFTNLDMGDDATYNFAGTAIRGRDSYTNRWTLVTLSGTDAATAAHSSGLGIVVISPTEVALWAGDNNEVNQGFVAAWTGIDPGDDGAFSVVSTQYTGATPGVGSGTADGSKSYALSAIRLEEIAPLGPLSWLERIGGTDTHTADDFGRDDDGSKGAENSEMTVPFGSTFANTMGVGFSDGQPAFEAAIDTDVAQAMLGVNASLWTRTEFVVADPSIYNTLTLRMKYDDGFVAYLNGTELIRRNADNPPAFDVTASAERDNLEAVVFEDFDVTASLGALQTGTNVLAIHGLNLTDADADFLIQPELIADGGIPATGIPLNEGINRVIVQAFDGFDGTGNELARDFIDIWYDPDADGRLIPGGTLTEDLVLDNGPYTVQGDVTVPAGVTLTIMPGQTIYFADDAGLTIQGRLLAEGTETQRILLTREDGAASWAGIALSYGSYSDQVNRITYTDFDYSDSSGDAIDVRNGQLVLDNVNFNNHGRSYYLDIHSSSIIVRNSTFPDLANGELIHATGFPSGGYALFEGNWFGRANGYNDVIDFTGGQRLFLSGQEPILRVMNNYFSGGGDDALDLDSTDAHIEGNVFVDFHQSGSRESKAHAIATGNDLDQTTEVTIVRNLFYDLDHAIIIKDGAFGTIVNNTIVNVYKKYTGTNATTAAINFFENRSGQDEANGVYLDGNIFYDVSWLFENEDPVGRPVAVTMNNSIVYPATTGETTPWVGTGNLIGVDPLLSDPNPTDITAAGLIAAFQLQAGSPAFGAGPNGVDVGGLIPAGATIAGEPSGTTSQTSATLTVGGPHGYAYKYRVNAGAFSGERGVMKRVQSITRAGSTATVTVAGHGYLSGDVVDVYGPEEQEYNGTFTITNVTADTFDFPVAGTPDTTADGTILVRRHEPIELMGLADGTYTVYAIEKDSAGVWQDEADATASRTWTVDTALPPKELAILNSLDAEYGGALPELAEKIEGWKQVVASAAVQPPPAASAKAAVVIPGGDLIADTLLTPEDGPYRVTGDVNVPAGVTLTIMPGTTVFFDAGAGITVGGRMLAEGTEYQRIRLTRFPGAAGAWGGLDFGYTEEDNRLAYVDMEFTNDPIDVNRSKLSMDRMTFGDTTQTVLGITYSSLIVRNSVFPGTSAQTVSGHHLLPADPYMLFENNVFGICTGVKEDVLDFTSDGDVVMPRFIGNVFLGGGDDALDLDGTNAYVEGNLFTNFHRNFDPADGESYAVTSGYNGNNSSNHVIVGNYFIDNDTAVLVKDRSWIELENNTIVDGGVGIRFDEPQEAGIDPGVGAYLDGNIFWNVATPLANYYVDDPTWGTTDITVNRSIIAPEYHSYGVGNIYEDPRLADPAGGDFSLMPGSPALGTGPNGIDMGAMVPMAASISGEPPALTNRTDATLTVGGPGITHFKFRINEGPFSAELPIDTPVALTGLSDGTYTIHAIGRSAAGVWHREADATASNTWTVDTSLARVRINEVLAINNTTLEHDGTYPDLIELVNDGPSAVDLAGMSISDDPDDPTRFVFPTGLPAETTIAPGGYLVLYADDETDAPGLHLGFGIDGDAEQVFLFDTAARGRVQLDTVAFGPQVPDFSIGRVGHGEDWALTQPSFGAANVAARTGDPATLKINEWLASSELLFTNDFVELYNPDPLPVDLGGLFLTDDPYAEPGKHELAALSFVPGDGFVALVADGDPEDGANHVDFRLSAEYEMIGLYNSELGEIDKVIYFSQTTDVSEGRAPDGSEVYDFFTLPTPGVANPTPDIVTVEAIGFDDVWEYEQSGDPPDPLWNQPYFVADPAWSTGPAPLGVENASLPIPLNTDLTLGPITFYFRTHFDVTQEQYNTDPAEVTLTMTTMIDDGAIFYLNGTEVLLEELGGNRLRMDPGDVDYLTRANPSVSNAVLEGPFTVPTGTLQQGDNVLAVEVHQINSTSSDVVFAMKLDVTAVAEEDEWITMGRDLLAGLRITEMMYNPAGDDDTEFIELQNTGEKPLNLDGVRLTDGIAFTFPPLWLAPQQYVVAVRDTEAFEMRYGSSYNVAGEYTGGLSNDGEDITLRLASPLLAAVLRFDFSDSWYPATDGDGFALEIRDPAAAALSWDDAASWQAGTIEGGTPGTADGVPLTSVVINEVLTHTDSPQVDTIELHNTTGGAIDVGGWYLSDAKYNYRKFRIPDGTVIPAGGYVVFDEADFNTMPEPPGQSNFALSGAHGDDVWLLEGDEQGRATQFVDHVEFRAAAAGESFGRWPNGAGPLYPMTRPTLDKEFPENGSNAGPRVGPVIISEVHYNPTPLENDDDLEFVEIHNPTIEEVDLTGWRLGKGVDFDFPAMTLGVYSTLVVVRFDPGDAAALAAFHGAYGIDESVIVVGPYTGRLSDGGEKVQLQRPDDPPADEPWFTPHLLEDEVIYSSAAPWPNGAAGNGDSLHRTQGDAWGNTETSWSDRPPTPGRPLWPVVGRYIFYNGSAFDGNDYGAGTLDDDAIAIDKMPLLPGQTASLANYTSYVRGINGIMIDVHGLPDDGATLGTDDFQFRVGNDDDPAGWVPAPGLPDVTVRPGEGVDGSDRVTLIWESNVIQKQWLQVTMLVTPDTGLEQADVFYFGNAIGETGNSTTEAKVNAIDMLGARDNQRNFFNPAPIDFSFDFDRNQRVNATDMLIARNNVTHFLNALRLISVPAAGKAAGPIPGQYIPGQYIPGQYDAGEIELPPARPETSAQGLDWLYEFDLSDTRHTASKDRSNEEAIDRVLAGYE